LNKLYILPFEGSSEGRDIYERATILSAIKLIRSKQYKSALIKIDASRAWPENLGVGKPYDVDERIQDYLKAYCLDKLGKSNESDELYKGILAATDENFERASVSN